MAIFKDIEFFWAKLNPDRPTQYQGKGNFKWSIQLRVLPAQKELIAAMRKDGFKLTPVMNSDETTVEYYRATVQRNAFKKDQVTKEETKEKNTPVSVILANGSPVDPATIGNGSRGNIRVNVFRTKEGEIYRTLEGIQLTRYQKYTPAEDEGFELSEEYEIIDDDSEDKTVSKSTDNKVY